VTGVYRGTDKLEDAQIGRLRGLVIVFTVLGKMLNKDSCAQSTK
jgi:uncharacterized protein YbjQ (UPF0145 family)